MLLPQETSKQHHVDLPFALEAQAVQGSIAARRQVVPGLPSIFFSLELATERCVESWKQVRILWAHTIGVETDSDPTTRVNPQLQVGTAFLFLVRLVYPCL